MSCQLAELEARARQRRIEEYLYQSRANVHDSVLDTKQTLPVF